MPAFIGLPGSIGSSSLAVARVIPENSSFAVWLQPSVAGSTSTRTRDLRHELASSTAYHDASLKAGRTSHAYEQAHDWEDTGTPPCSACLLALPPGPERRPLLSVSDSELTPQDPSPRCRGRSRNVELHPAGVSLDVRAPAPSLDQVEVEKRLTAHVEDARFLLGDARPGADLVEEIGQVVQELRRPVRHEAILRHKAPRQSRGAPAH
jgi:hypothetical protein